MSSDICILPAYKNDIMRNIVPIKLYEYMAGGKPVISTSLPGILREFGTANGVIFVDRPEEVLAKASELVGTGRLQEEGDRAGRFAAGNSWDTVTKTFESALLSLLSEIP
jgi:glycosyltransferase involved in cell wall biosynthesis